MNSAHLLLGLAVATSLAACNGGGGDSSNAASPQAGTGASANETPKISATRYDAFFDGTTLNLVDRNAATPAALALSNFGGTGQTPRNWQFHTGTLTGTGLAGISSKYLLYVNAGHFYRVDLNSLGLPAPEQLSSESEANLICDAHKYQSVHTEIAGLSYSLRGADGLCGTNDDVFKRVTLTQGQTELPKSISRQEFASIPLFNAQDWGTGSLSLAQGNIEWRDSDFANPQMLFSGNTFSELKPLHSSTDQRYVLFAASLVSGDVTSWHLFVFDQQSRTLSQDLGQTQNAPSYDSSVGFERIGVYNGEIYLTRNHTDIVAVPENGSQPATTIVNNGKGVAILGDRLIFSELVARQGAVNFSSISLTDPTPAITLIKSGVTAAIATKDRLFYTQKTTSSDGTTATSGSLRPDGSDDRVSANTIIAGLSVNSDSYDWGAKRNVLINRIFFISNPIFGNGGSYAGGTLQAISAGTGEQVKTLGAVPTGAINYWVASAEYSGVVLGSSQTQDGNGRSLYVIDQAGGKQQWVGTAYNSNDWWTDWMRGN